MQSSDKLTNNETAVLLGVTPQTLMTWRSRGHGPKFLKIGRRCFYRQSDVDAWVNAQLRDPAKAKESGAAEARS